MDRNKILIYLDNLVFTFFCGFVFFLPISNSGVEISFGCILIGLVIRSLLRPFSTEQVKIFFSDRINLAVLIFFLCLGISMLASGSLFLKSLRAWFSKWGEGVALFYCARIFLKKRQIKILIFVLLGATFLVCIDGLYQKMTGVDFIRGFESNFIRGVYPVKACFGHQNDFATFLVVMFFVNLGVVCTFRKNWIKVLCGTLSVLTTANIIFTYSRGAWIAFLAGCLFLAFFVRNKTVKAALFFMVAVFLGVIFTIPLLRGRILYILQKGGDAGRLRKWKTAIAIFKDSPLIGTGVGLFMDNFYKKASGSHYAHNCYLQVLAEAGVLGLMSFLWSFTEIVLNAFRNMRKNMNLMLLGTLTGLLAYAFYSFFDTQLFSLRLSLLFWMLCALVVQMSGWDDEKAI